MFEHRIIRQNHSSPYLVMAIHGFGANEHDLISLAPVLDPQNRWDWLFVQAPIRLAQDSYCWFPKDPQDQQAAMMGHYFNKLQAVDPTELLERVEELKTFARTMAKGRKIILLGFSQGAIISSHLWARMGRDSLTATLLYSGALMGEANLTGPETVEITNRSPVFQSHGVFDPILPIDEAQALTKAMVDAGAELKFISFEGAHGIPMEILEQTRNWLEEIQL